jgi:hypothetical protein
MELITFMLIVSLHVIIFILPPLIGSFLDPHDQITLNYTYIGVLYVLVQIFDNLYSIDFSEQISLFGGDVTYSALLFSSLYLVFTRPDPKIVRNLIYIATINTFFLYLIFGLVNWISQRNYATTYLDIPEIFDEFRLTSLMITLLLFASELIITLVIIQNLPLKIRSQKIAPFIMSIVFIVILIIDGILYPLLINLVYNNNLSIVNSIITKFTFGLGFGATLLLLLYLRPGNMDKLLTDKVNIYHYFIPPRNKGLKEELELAQKHIKKLEQFLSICANCKKIKDEQGNWKRLEDYLFKYEKLEFSHGLCTDCSKKAMGELNNQ